MCFGKIVRNSPNMDEHFPLFKSHNHGMPVAKVITEPEKRGGLRMESTILAEAGAVSGVGFLNENRTRSWSRSENFSFYSSRIINFIKF